MKFEHDGRMIYFIFFLKFPSKKSKIQSELFEFDGSNTSIARANNDLNEVLLEPFWSINCNFQSIFFFKSRELGKQHPVTENPTGAFSHFENHVRKNKYGRNLVRGSGKILCLSLLL